jgi:hypothetical protein
MDQTALEKGIVEGQIGVKENDTAGRWIRAWDDG